MALRIIHNQSIALFFFSKTEQTISRKDIDPPRLHQPNTLGNLQNLLLRVHQTRATSTHLLHLLGGRTVLALFNLWWFNRIVMMFFRTWWIRWLQGSLSIDFIWWHLKWRFCSKLTSRHSVVMLIFTLSVFSAFLGLCIWWCKRCTCCHGRLQWLFNQTTDRCPSHRLRSFSGCLHSLFLVRRCCSTWGNICSVRAFIFRWSNVAFSALTVGIRCLWRRSWDLW